LLIKRMFRAMIHRAARTAYALLEVLDLPRFSKDKARRAGDEGDR